MARLFAVTEPLPKSKEMLRAYAKSLTPNDRAGDYAQAVMDLGATVCTPTSPACVLCPWSDACVARAEDIAETLPRKLKKADPPQRYGVAFWMVKDGAVLLRRRPAKGLLGGMVEVPSTPWRANAWSIKEAQDEAPVKARWRTLDGEVTHTFTHFRLSLQTCVADLTPAQAKAFDDALWTPLDALGDVGFPSVMRKLANHALKGIA